jgi:hypothetical protein
MEKGGEGNLGSILIQQRLVMDKTVCVLTSDSLCQFSSASETKGKNNKNKTNMHRSPSNRDTKV